MTKGWLGTPEATRVLDRLLLDTHIDADLEALRRHEQNDAIYIAAVTAWFRRTDPVNR